MVGFARGVSAWYEVLTGIRGVVRSSILNPVALSSTRMMLGMLIVGSAEAYMLCVVNAKSPLCDAPLTLRVIVAQSGQRT